MAEFVAGWISGSIGVLVGNPLDVIKVRLQSRNVAVDAAPGRVASFDTLGSLVRGTAAPVLGYGALNAILFVTYSQTLALVAASPQPDLLSVFTAGAAGGLACFVVSAPTELVKCRAQVSGDASWSIAKDIWRNNGLRGLYLGGGVTCVRDAVGYGFYFWSYEGVKRGMGLGNETIASLVAGGVAGCVTWASIYPLDLIKTRVQLQSSISTKSALLQFRPPSPAPLPSATTPLTSSTPLVLPSSTTSSAAQLGAWAHTKLAYREGGYRVFFGGFWACMIRAFVVNSVQWASYEALMKKM